SPDSGAGASATAPSSIAAPPQRIATRGALPRKKSSLPAMIHDLVMRASARLSSRQEHYVLQDSAHGTPKAGLGASLQSPPGSARSPLRAPVSATNPAEPP